MNNNIRNLTITRTITALAALAALAGLGSCTQTPGSKAEDGTPKLTLTAVAPTTATQANNLDVLAKKSAGGFDITVKAGPDFQDSDAVFFNIAYDPQAFHALGLETAHGTDSGMGPTPNTIGLSVEPLEGSIDSGVTAIGTSSGESIQSGDTLVSFTLVPGPEPKTATEAPDSAYSRARNLDLAQDSEGNWTLSWDYTNPGDTNQDGEVGINDLTPIGMHYLEQVENEFDDPLRHIDGDHNGEINLADMTSIGQNYSTDLWAYQVEMSEDGENNFITVGQLLLGEQNSTPGETVRFSYTFGAQYVENYWYRVVPVDKALAFGTPSEAISEGSRMLAGVQSEPGQKLNVTVNVHDLAVPLAQLNSVRIVYPADFSYVKDSYNCGSPGGTRDAIDGLWASFATTILFPPEAFIVEQTLPDGNKALDLNVTVIEKSLPASPTGYGDLFNLQLESASGGELSLQFQVQSTDGLTRTYYTDANDQPQSFGSSLGLEAQ